MFVSLYVGIKVMDVQEDTPSIPNIGEFPGPDPFTEAPYAHSKVYAGLFDAIKPFTRSPLGHSIIWLLIVCKTRFHFGKFFLKSVFASKGPFRAKMPLQDALGATISPGGNT